MKKIKFFTIIIPSLVLVLALTTCISAKSLKDINVFFIVKSSSQYQQTTKDGGNRAAMDYGINITFQEPSSEKEIAKQISILDTAIITNPDAIVIAPITTDSLVPGIEKAMDKGIKVILLDSSVSTENYTSFLASDNYGGGKIAADTFANLVKQKWGKIEGKVGILASSAGVNTQRDRINGFLDQIKENYPGLEPLEVQYSEHDISKAIAQSNDIFTAHPKDLVGIYGAYSGGVEGIIRAIEISGVDISKMTFVGFDANSMEVDALKKGIIDTLIVQRPWHMGYYGVIFAINAIQDVPVPRYVDTGLAVVTKANMDTVGESVLNPIEYHKNH